MFSIIDKAEKHFNIPEVSAHCDIPCKIYDPIHAQIATLSILRFMDLIAESDYTNLEGQAKISRLVREKEIHAEKVKQEVRVIWGDYIKAPQIEMFPEIHTLVHNIMLAGSACKQHTTRENGEKLLTLVNDFAEIFWATKGIKTFKATCPYPPEEQLVYPKLDA